MTTTTPLESLNDEERLRVAENSPELAVLQIFVWENANSNNNRRDARHYDKDAENEMINEL